MDKTAVLRASQSAATCDLDGGKAVMDLTSGVYFKLNSTASFFFSILEQPTSYLSALAQMQDHFDVDSEVLKMDCDVLANELLEKGLIVIES